MVIITNMHMVIFTYGYKTNMHMFIFINGSKYFQGGYYFVLKRLINNYYSIISMAHDCDS